MVERKCLSCGTWNNDEDYCKSCGAPVSPQAVDKAEEEKRRMAKSKEKPDKLDIWMEKAKNHKYLIVRMAYQVLYGIGVVVGLFGALMAWIVAMANA